MFSIICILVSYRLKIEKIIKNGDTFDFIFFRRAFKIIRFPKTALHYLILLCFCVFALCILTVKNENWQKKALPGVKNSNRHKRLKINGKGSALDLTCVLYIYFLNKYIYIAPIPCLYPCRFCREVSALFCPENKKKKN